MSDTPKTDAAVLNVMTWKSPAGVTLDGESTGWVVVEADFARTLERRIAELEAERGLFPRMEEVAEFIALERDLAAARQRIAALEAERGALLKSLERRISNPHMWGCSCKECEDDEAMVAAGKEEKP